MKAHVKYFVIPFREKKWVPHMDNKERTKI